ncbi:MAG TPA: HAD-IIB family hydrolase [Candidatus Saccharimonadia bacterium]|nr:HAD-IIB family hydrolase [Candidatus Saccharimonadia bacterium]
MLDLDGTCTKIGMEFMPNVAVVRAVKKMIGRGIPVSVASGRNIADADKVLVALGIVEPCMLMNGSILYDPKLRRSVETIAIDSKIVAQICEIARKDTEKIVLCTPYETYYIKDHPPHTNITGIFIEKLSKQEADAYIRMLEKIPNITMHTSGLSFDGSTTFVSVNEIHATKQRALQHLLKRLNIAAEDIVAVGDGENDLPMVIAAGMGVAMGNAAEGLRSIADFIAPSVDDDGLVAVIEKFFPEG